MKNRRISLREIVLLSSAMLLTGHAAAMAQEHDVTLAQLSAGDSVEGFRATALYLNDADEPMGGRFIHQRTGFTFDLLQIEAVPQGFIWVNSFPTSNMGEPHTQEHLLLGKGNRGRAVANLDDMSLARMSAFTQQFRTAYHFHTAAGTEVFYNLFERRVDALLHPDYTDEEIRREVRNFGVTEDPANGTVRLEEKGTVYNEMVSAFDRPGRRLFYALGIALYGSEHPLAYSSGGLPSAIRDMKPEDIKQFHYENYHLANMGMVSALPRVLPLGDALSRMNGILNRLQPDPTERLVKTESDLPAPQMDSEGAIHIITYPHKNAQQPGLMLFVWPATLELASEEQLLLELFLDNVAGDATTNLYKRFIDTQTREVDLGARSMFSFVDEARGHPIYIGLTDVASAHMTEESVAMVRQKIMEEMGRIASFEDGSAELAEFNGRISDRLIERRRDLSKFMNSPPGFGFRGTGSAWISHLRELNRAPQFRKSVTMKRQLAFVEERLEGETNFWPAYIAQWRLANTRPYVGAARADPKLVEQAAQERQTRVATEVARLRAQYGVDDDQAAIRRYQAGYDAATAELEQLAKQDAAPRFVDAPPLTLDDQLEYAVSTLPGEVQMVLSTFDNMTSATIGLALRLAGTPQDELTYLSILPALLTEVGVIQDGTPVSYEQMRAMLRREILGLDAYYSTNFRTNRAELVLRGAGNNVEEAQRAVDWMNMILLNPDWRPENLARIRDVVDQSLSRLRNTMLGREEFWVSDPARAYRRQDNPLLLATASFLTRMHKVHRLRWMLKDAETDEDREAISQFLTALAGAGAQAPREELHVLIGSMQAEEVVPESLPMGLKSLGADFRRLPAGVGALAAEAAKDLEQIMPGIPDETLVADWSYLCRQMLQDLLLPPEKALMSLHAVRRRLLKTGGARMFLIGSTTSQQQLEGKIRELLFGLEIAPTQNVTYSSTRLIDTRLRDRSPEAAAPAFVGLLNPNVQGGVFLNSAPGVTYQDTDRDVLLDYLASKLYAGGGAHSIFMKTWGAGLAYSNGLGGSPGSGRQRYYAERTPELPQTLRFVIEELRKAPRDLNLVEYAVAQTFAGLRSPQGYETRGEAMAADLADGVMPETVSRFRRAILDLRLIPNLSNELYNRMDGVYARVLPGYGVKAESVAGAVYFVIGPEKQFGLYEAYLKSVEGPDARLFRLYPRDFWMTSAAGTKP